MDKFAVTTGLIGLVIGLLALLVLIYLISRLVKRKAGAGRVFNLLLNSAVLAVLAAAFIFLSLFVQTLTPTCTTSGSAPSPPGRRAKA